MQPRPLSVTITSVLIVLSAIIWLILGILLALDAHPGFPDDPLIRAWMAALSIAAACILFMLVIYLEKRLRLAYFGMLAALAAAALVIFLDQVGPVDLMVLVINVIPLALLIKNRRLYLSPEAGPPASSRKSSA